ncbi:MAG TPA: response regulator transcription factor [Candidatus Acidoferrales bacterium]|nr:response regulator transcription factor [Candidatus Acidoferrales bacterium]
MPIAAREATPSVTSKSFRVLIVDDHAVVRRGLRTLLASQPGLEVCGEAATGAEALNLVRKNKPELVILDLTMPDMNGLDATRAIREESPNTTVLILTMHFSDELAREALRSGALGYVLKSDADRDLLAAVDHVRHGQPFFTGCLAASMVHTFVDGPVTSLGAGDSASTLTQREVEILQALAEGKSNKQVASALDVSTRTVESHRNHIMRKMGFDSFSDLVRFAVRNNLVEP